MTCRRGSPSATPRHAHAGTSSRGRPAVTSVSFGRGQNRRRTSPETSAWGEGDRRGIQRVVDRVQLPSGSVRNWSCHGGAASSVYARRRTTPAAALRRAAQRRTRPGRHRRSRRSGRRDLHVARRRTTSIPHHVRQPSRGAIGPPNDRTHCRRTLASSPGRERSSRIPPPRTMACRACHLASSAPSSFRS